MKKIALFLVFALLFTLLSACANRESNPSLLIGTNKKMAAEYMKDSKNFSESLTDDESKVTWTSENDEYTENPSTVDLLEGTAVTKWPAADESDENYEYRLIDDEYYEVIRRFDYSVKVIDNIPAELNGYPVKSIGGYFGDLCDTIKSVILPHSITNLADFSFFGCDNLENIVLHDGLISIGSQSFIGCSFKSIDIPDTVTYIGGATFQQCRNLESIIIPDGVTKINSSTFYLCNNLKCITIPKSVKEINSNAFQGCEKLETVYYKGTEDEFNSIFIDTVNEDFVNATVVFLYNQESGD